jgi:hypothetical protein
MSADVNPLLTKTYIAEGAIIKHEVVMAGTANNQVKPATGAGVLPVGVAMHAAAAGESVDLVMLGPTKVIASAAVARGVLVRISNTDGEVDDFTVAATTVTYSCGYSLESAGADQDLFSIFFMPGYAATS